MRSARHFMPGHWLTGGPAGALEDLGRDLPGQRGTLSPVACGDLGERQDRLAASRVGPIREAMPADARRFSSMAGPPGPAGRFPAGAGRQAGGASSSNPGVSPSAAQERRFCRSCPLFERAGALAVLEDRPSARRMSGPPGGPGRRRSPIKQRLLRGTACAGCEPALRQVPVRPAACQASGGSAPAAASGMSPLSAAERPVAPALPSSERGTTARSPSAAARRPHRPTTPACPRGPR